MRLYEVVSLLLCSWKAEVYINKIYDTAALKGITIWKHVTPTSPKQTQAHLHYGALLSRLPDPKRKVSGRKISAKDLIHQMFDIPDIAKCVRTPERYADL